MEISCLFTIKLSSTTVVWGIAKSVECKSLLFLSSSAAEQRQEERIAACVAQVRSQKEAIAQTIVTGEGSDVHTCLKEKVDRETEVLCCQISHSSGLRPHGPPNSLILYSIVH